MREQTIYTLFALLTMLALGVVAGAIIATTVERGRAIEAGVGRWEIDASCGEKTFVYAAAPPARCPAPICNPKPAERETVAP